MEKFQSLGTIIAFSVIVFGILIMTPVLPADDVSVGACLVALAVARLL